eukprot:4535641-Pleurochrysis_carterae.AAC.7
MADSFLPSKLQRKSTTSPAWFTDQGQRVSTFSKLGIATTEFDSAIKQGVLKTNPRLRTFWAC